MPATKLKGYFDRNSVKYVGITHSLAYTAQEISASAHIPGRNFIKTVMIKIKGKMAMAVLPASFNIVGLLQNLWVNGVKCYCLPVKLGFGINRSLCSLFIPG